MVLDDDEYCATFSGLYIHVFSTSSFTLLTKHESFPHLRKMALAALVLSDNNEINRCSDYLMIHAHNERNADAALMDMLEYFGVTPTHPYIEKNRYGLNGERATVAGLLCNGNVDLLVQLKLMASDHTKIIPVKYSIVG